MPAVTSRTERFSETILPALVVHGCLTTLGEENGTDNEDMNDTILAKGIARQPVMEVEIDATFPTAEDLNFQKNKPLWFVNMVRALAVLRKQAAMRGFQHGFVEDYSPSLFRGFQLGIDAVDFSPPVTSQSGCWRFFKLIGEDEILEPITIQEVNFMHNMEGSCTQHEHGEF